MSFEAEKLPIDKLIETVPALPSEELKRILVLLRVELQSRLSPEEHEEFLAAFKRVVPALSHDQFLAIHNLMEEELTARRVSDPSFAFHPPLPYTSRRGSRTKSGTGNEGVER